MKNADEKKSIKYTDRKNSVKNDVRKSSNRGNSVKNDVRKSSMRNDVRKNSSKHTGGENRVKNAAEKGSRKHIAEKNSMNNAKAKGNRKHSVWENGMNNAVRKSSGKCSVEKKCGGCQMISLDYKRQLDIKQKKVKELIGQFGKVDKIIGMDCPYYYRNKVHAAFDHDRKGNVISGIYEENSHRVIPIDSCYLEDQKADAIIVTIRNMLKSFKLKTYDEDTGYGFLRHVLIRTAHKTGQIMVVLVTGTPVFPSKNNFIKALRKEHPDITTIVQNVNDKKTSMILGEREIVLYGKGFIIDELCGRTFKISPKSFSQVNSVQTEVLYNKAMEFAALTGKERVIDAYCGIGTIGMVAAAKAGSVIGVELNKDAVRDAVTNKKFNKVSNIEFYNADAGKFLNDMASEGEKADVIFMDPPRSGSTEVFIDAVVNMSPSRVVYVSCDPETLARDLKYFMKKGYEMKKAVTVDMFPNTVHVETIVALHRTDM